jgi:uncharacterized protein YjbJ (UPF0337 family)
MKLSRLFIILCMILFPAFITIGCAQEKGPAEKAGAKVDDAVGDVKDATEDAVDATEEAVKDAERSVEDATD